MAKLKMAVIFGGQSVEHDISICTAIRTKRYLDPAKYELTYIAVGKDGQWYLPNSDEVNEMVTMLDVVTKFTDPRFTNVCKFRQKIDPGYLFAETFDVILPVIHGTGGEDGALQGLLEFVDVPYVSPGVTGSAVGMDKEIFKRVVRDIGLPVVPFLAITPSTWSCERRRLMDKIAETIGYPCMIKPAHLGSSIGATKAFDEFSARQGILDALAIDDKVIVETFINGSELQCHVVAGNPPETSGIMEIIPHFEFYTFEAKYIQKEAGSTRSLPPAEFSQADERLIRQMSCQIFEILDSSGMIRVDFFRERNSGDLYVNEVNLIPAYSHETWESTGRTCRSVFDQTIDQAIARHEKKRKLKRDFSFATGGFSGT